MHDFRWSYTRAVNEWRIAQRAELADKEAELRKIERELEKLVRAIMDGVAALSIKDKILAFEERKVQLEKELETADEPPSLLHPNMAKVYSRKINALYEALQSDEGRPTMADLLRTLIDRIVLEPADGKLDILIEGDIVGILSFASAEKELPATAVRGGQVAVVAGCSF